MGPLGVLGVLYIMYLLFSKATSIILSPKIHPKYAERGDNNIFYIILTSSPPSIGGVDFVLRIIAVTLADTKYMIYNTPSTPSEAMIHALQISATYMPQYHKSILPRAKISAHTKIGSPSEFKCDSNALIFSPIGRELSELREFYEMYLKMEIFRPRRLSAPLVPQIAVILYDPDQVIKKLS